MSLLEYRWTEYQIDRRRRWRGIVLRTCTMKAQDKGERPLSDQLWDTIKRNSGLSASLSDQLWDRIARVSGLPEQARSQIEYSIACYWRWLESEVMPAKTKKQLRKGNTKTKLRKLGNQAKELLEDFEEVLGTEYFQLVVLIGPQIEWHPPNFEQRVGGTSRRSAGALAKKGDSAMMMIQSEKFAEQVRADLKALIDWLDQSERAIKREKAGAAISCGRPPVRRLHQ
jgi:hypothetical protein